MPVDLTWGDSEAPAGGGCWRSAGTLLEDSPMPVATGSAILTNLIMMVTRIDHAASLAACQAAEAGFGSCSGVGTGSGRSG